MATVLEIWVRRFFCNHCCISVSCLPQFAQPYRVVNSDTVQAAFDEQHSRPEVQRWWVLLQSYWRRFQRHLPEGVGEDKRTRDKRDKEDKQRGQGRILQFNNSATERVLNLGVSDAAKRSTITESVPCFG